MTQAELLELHLRCCLHAWAYGSYTRRMSTRSCLIGPYRVLVVGRDQARAYVGDVEIFNSMNVNDIKCPGKESSKGLLTALRSGQILDQLSDL